MTDYAFLELKIDKNNNQHIQGTIDRGCKPKNYCEEVKDFSLHCSSCTTDLCNTVSGVQPSLTIITLIILRNLM